MYRDEFSRHRIMAVVTIIMIVAVVLVGRPSQTTAQFVLASWDYPDEYGQGIDNIEIWQYLSGSWEKHPMTTFGYGPNGNDTFPIEAGGALLLEIDCWLNGTLTGVGSLGEGLDYIRHSVLVTSPHNSSVFSKQNFTYMTGSDSLAPMYFYKYNVTLSFSPVFGTIYTAKVDYDIFYTSEYSLLDSDASPTWGGEWLTDGPDGTVGNIFYSLANGDNDEDGAIETGITVDNDFGTVTFGLDLTITAYNEQCTSIDITVMLWSGVAAGSEEIVYSSSLSGTGAVNITGSTSLSIIESFLVNITYVGTVSGDYVNMTIDSYLVEFTDYDWHTVTSLVVILIPPIASEEQIFLGNAALIILGLVMIPVSTIYLAYGAKHDRSSDRLFYGLILFFLGCGLLIGGILP